MENPCYVLLYDAFAHMHYCQITQKLVHHKVHVGPGCPAMATAKSSKLENETNSVVGEWVFVLR
jgi:hypothetical protein